MAKQGRPLKEQQITEKKELPLILKPSIMNALFPIIIKNFVIALLYCFFLVAILVITKYIWLAEITFIEMGVWAIFFLIFAVFVPLLLRLFVLANTRYYFEKTHITSEFKFVLIKKYSVPYNKITNISVDISIWDRLTRAGDLVVHSAEDQTKDLTLFFIKKPQDVEKLIYSLIARNRPST